MWRSYPPSGGTCVLYPHLLGGAEERVAPSHIVSIQLPGDNAQQSATSLFSC